MSNKLKPHQRETIDAVMTLAALGLIPQPLVGAGKSSRFKTGGYTSAKPEGVPMQVTNGSAYVEVIKPKPRLVWSKMLKRWKYNAQSHASIERLKYAVDRKLYWDFEIHLNVRNGLE